MDVKADDPQVPVMWCGDESHHYPHGYHTGWSHFWCWGVPS